MNSLKTKYKIFLLIFSLSFLCTSCSVFGIRNEEQPSYEVLHEQGGREIRAYKPYVVAKTIVSGTFKEAQSKGFKVLAGYIFGDNKSQQKIPMTAPVFMEKADGTTQWTVVFSMPSKYNLETLPTPNNKNIILEKVEAKIMAASIYSGFWSEKKNNKKYMTLLKWMNTSQKYNAVSGFVFAGYNPPWTIPFFRRNEVLINLEIIE